MISRTLAQLQTAVRQRTEMENSGFVTDDELADYINTAYATAYNLMVTCYGEDYYSSSYTFTSDGSETYSLPSDFMKAVAVDVTLSSGARVGLKTFAFGDRNRSSGHGLPTEPMLGHDYFRYRIRGNNIWFRPSITSGTSITLLYVPHLTELSAPTDTISGIPGFVEFVMVSACIKVMMKQESDVSSLVGQLNALKADLKQTAPSRDQESCTVRDPYSSMMVLPWE